MPHDAPNVITQSLHNRVSFDMCLKISATTGSRGINFHTGAHHVNLYVELSMIYCLFTDQLVCSHDNNKLCTLPLHHNGSELLLHMTTSSHVSNFFMSDMNTIKLHFHPLVMECPPSTTWKLKTYQYIFFKLCCSIKCIQTQLVHCTIVCENGVPYYYQAPGIFFSKVYKIR